MPMDKVKVQVHDNFNNYINQFVTSSLIKPQDKTSNNEHLEALKDSYNLLISNTTTLNSIL